MKVRLDELCVHGGSLGLVDLWRCTRRLRRKHKKLGHVAHPEIVEVDK